MRPWDAFFRQKMEEIFAHGGLVIDVGGGLRVKREKGNRYDASREWLRPLIERVDYTVLDVVDTYHPDIVGDIEKLPFAETSVDSIICIAVLQHVKDPRQAMREIHRVLMPGGKAFIYVPFLFYYHGEKGYYEDYWRFTKDALAMLAEPFAKAEIAPVRGAIETWIKLSPLGRWKVFNELGFWLDRLTGKSSSKQVSGYNVFLTK